MKIQLFYLTMVIMLLNSKSISAQNYDFSLVDMDTNKKVAFNDIYKTYNLDRNKPTLLISWSGSWCSYCIDLIERYQKADLTMINLITVNIDNEADRNTTINKGYHKNWKKSVNMYGTLKEDDKGFNYYFNVGRAPLILAFIEGYVSDVVMSYSIYPYKLVSSGHITNINFIWNSSSDLNSYAWDHYLNENNPEKLKEAIRWVNRSIELKKEYHNTDTLASLLFKTGEYVQALKTAKEAIEIAQKNNQDYKSTTDLIQKIIEKM